MNAVVTQALTWERRRRFPDAEAPGHYVYEEWQACDQDDARRVHGLQSWQTRMVLTPAFSPEPSADPWLAAVLYACNEVACCVHEDDAHRTVACLIGVHRALALDPDVSPEAYALVQRGAAAAGMHVHNSAAVEHALTLGDKARLLVRSWTDGVPMPDIVTWCTKAAGVLSALDGFVRAVALAGAGRVVGYHWRDGTGAEHVGARFPESGARAVHPLRLPPGAPLPENAKHDDKPSR